MQSYNENKIYRKIITKTIISSNLIYNIYFHSSSSFDTMVTLLRKSLYPGHQKSMKYGQGTSCYQHLSTLLFLLGFFVRFFVVAFLV